MITIKDIAKEANVSIGTVDRVIHNRSGVSKKTKEHINRIIKAHNFQVNKTARTLALNKKYNIAVLIPDYESESDFWFQPKKGIDKAAEEIEIYRTTISYFYFNQFDADSFKNTFNTLLSGSVDAVLLAPVFFKETQQCIVKLEQMNIPYVFINIEFRGVNNISYIGQHSIDSGALAAKLMSLLISKNEDVLLIKVRKDSIHHSAIEERVSGFKSYFKNERNSIKIHETILTDIKDQNSINQIISKCLVTNTQIKGFFVPSSYVSLIATYLETLGLQHLKLIGYDLNQENIDFIKNETIDFLIDQNAFSQGYEGAKILFNFIANNIVPEKTHYSPIKLLTKENIEYL